VKVDWSQNPAHLKTAADTLGVEYRCQPVYWLSVVGDDGELCCVWVYHNFSMCSAEISVVVLKRRAFRRDHLRTMFAYPFYQLGLRRLHSVVKETNVPSLEQTSRLGFAVEGLLRNWYPDCDGILHGLLKENCKWL
jgi:hypothetical protein